jgi:sialidase-1
LGASWNIGGGIEVEGANESVVVETSTGAIYLNSRDQHGRGYRFTARSDDGGLTFHDVGIDETLTDPPCQATALAITGVSGDPLVFLNPAGPGRSMLTARVSLDEGRTWQMPFLIHPGLAAYSDLVQLHPAPGCTEPRATLLALYETGTDNDCDRLVQVRLTVDGAGTIELLKMDDYQSDVICE